MRRVWQGDQIKINNLALACPGIVLHANIAFTDLDHTHNWSLLIYWGKSFSKYVSVSWIWCPLNRCARSNCQRRKRRLIVKCCFDVTVVWPPAGCPWAGGPLHSARLPHHLAEDQLVHHLHNPSDRHSLTQGRSAAGGRVAVWSIAGASTASTWHMWPPGVARVAGALHNHHLHSLWSQDSRPTGAAILPTSTLPPRTTPEPPKPELRGQQDGFWSDTQDLVSRCSGRWPGVRSPVAVSRVARASAMSSEAAVGLACHEGPPLSPFSSSFFSSSSCCCCC